MLLQQDFEKLLAAYFEGELDDDELVKLVEAIRQTPGHRRRFQRELRLHTLMRESASVLLEEKGADKLLPIASEPRRVAWWQVASVAAALILGVFLLQSVWNQSAKTNLAGVGHCLHVSESNEAIVWRDGVSSELTGKTTLQAGDRIESKNQGQASLKLDGIGILTLQDRTELVVLPADDPAKVVIQKGLVLIDADKREPGTPPILIRTPKAEIEIMGTVFALEVISTATRVRVHEGQVRYADRSSKQSVEVDAGEYCVTGKDKLVAIDQGHLSPGALMPGQFRLAPIADACSDGPRFLNDPYLKVEKNRRSSFLKFEIPTGGEVLEAKLRLTQSVDPGRGRLKVWAADNDNWSEQSLTRETAPTPAREVTRYDGWVSLGQVIELDVSSLVQDAGVYTLVITLENLKSNDIWFGSKESLTPPELILTRRMD